MTTSPSLAPLIGGSTTGADFRHCAVPASCEYARTWREACPGNGSAPRALLCPHAAAAPPSGASLSRRAGSSPKPACPADSTSGFARTCPVSRPAGCELTSSVAKGSARLALRVACRIRAHAIRKRHLKTTVCRVGKEQPASSVGADRRMPNWGRCDKYRAQRAGAASEPENAGSQRPVGGRRKVCACSWPVHERARLARPQKDQDSAKACTGHACCVVTAATSGRYRLTSGRHRRGHGKRNSETLGGKAVAENKNKIEKRGRELFVGGQRTEPTT
jgi:hypothetical protein